MAAGLSEIGKLPQGKRGQALIEALRSIDPASNATAQIQGLVHSSLDDSVGPVASRQLLDEVLLWLDGVKDASQRRTIVEATLDSLSARQVGYEDQLAGLREKLARVLEEEEDWSSAAKALLSISVDTGKRATDEYKLQLYMRAVRLFLEDDDSVSAEGPFNRASLIIHTSTDIATQLSYRLCQARILDSQRKFNEATTKYHNLSFAVEIDEEERLIFLQQAITCAILAPAGPIRSRALSSLFRDERSAQTPFYAVLSKMFLDQMIPESEVTAFAASLKPHQLAKLPPSSVVIPETDEDRAAPSTARRAPMNVLDRAIMEHNLLSASKLYLNITCTGLGLLLSLTPSAAEVLARTMVQQGRLSATINQVSGLIEFEVKPKEVEAAVSNVGIAAAATDRQEDQVHAPATVQWDMRIRQANQMTEDIAMRIAQLHPVLA